jgi:hypothetical protein
MAYPTPVNNLITDSVSQADVLTLASSPAMAAAMLYQAVAQAMGNAANNATMLQLQGSNITMAIASTASAIILSQKPKPSTT